MNKSIELCMIYGGVIMDKEKLLAKYPDKKEIIEKAFAEMSDDGCSGCKKGRIMRQLLMDLGEALPMPMRPIPMRPDYYLPPNYSVPPHAGAPRPPCEDCFKEHIAKAIVLLTEAGMGYPEHRWLAIANLAEASAEILGLDPKKANDLRAIKLKMIQDKTYVPDLMEWLV